MKLETVQTTTFYFSVSPGDVVSLQDRGWREFPTLSHDLLLRPALVFLNEPSQLVARIQVRADFLTDAQLQTAGEDTPELRVSPQDVPALNDNLVGPISPLSAAPTGP